MQFNLRQALYENIKNNSQADFQATIVDAIQDGEEKLLPGLGYLFELVWQTANENEKREILTLLEKSMQLKPS